MSLTSQCSKLMEAIIRDEIVEYLEASKLLNDSQHGFRAGRSCLKNMLVFLDKVTEWVDNGDAVDVVFLDLAKAFDKVPHQRLLLKLSSLGIGGKLFEWTVDETLVVGSDAESLYKRCHIEMDLGVKRSATGFGPGTATVLDFYK